MDANWNPTQYDQQPLPHQTWGPAVINRAHIHGHETIIDAGCGTGRDLETVTQLLQERTALAGQDHLGGNTHGFDLNTDMLTKAAERFHHYPTRWQPTLTEANTLNPWPVGNADLVVLHAMGDTEILKVAEATGNTVDYVRLEWEAAKK